MQPDDHLVIMRVMKVMGDRDGSGDVSLLCTACGDVVPVLLIDESWPTLEALAAEAGMHAAGCVVLGA
jgi:hypothetical protein